MNREEEDEKKHSSKANQKNRIQEGKKTGREKAIQGMQVIGEYHMKMVA